VLPFDQLGPVKARLDRCTTPQSLHTESPGYNHVSTHYLQAQITVKKHPINRECIKHIPRSNTSTMSLLPHSMQYASWSLRCNCRSHFPAAQSTDRHIISTSNGRIEGSHTSNSQYILYCVWHKLPPVRVELQQVCAWRDGDGIDLRNDVTYNYSTAPCLT
jgi:hypothetical protein